MYDSSQWSSFFVTVGGGAAALAGLVFVALTLHVQEITHDATHRYRAIGTLAGYIGIFCTCALVSMGGQNGEAAGAEWIVVALLAGAVYVNGYFESVRQGGTKNERRLGRVVVNATFYLGQIVGAALLVSGQTVGLYVASISMVAGMAFLTSGAWLLIVGVERSRSSRGK